jgi:hypothetical protein
VTPGGGLLDPIRGVEPGEDEVDEGRVRASFLLFAGGAVLAFLGTLVLAAGQLFPWTAEVSTRYVLRHVGGVALGVGATGLLLGLVAGLMPEGWIRWTAAAGAVVSLVGVGGFAYAYPTRWGVGADLSLPVVAVLLAGYTLLAGSAIASVAANLVLRERARDRLREKLDREPTDAEVAADVEEALRDSSWTWGGVEEDPSKPLEVASAQESADVELHGWKLKLDLEEEDGGRLDESVSALSAMRGGNEQTGEGQFDDADSKVQRLAQVQAEGPPEPARKGRWGRLRDWVGGLM